MTTQTSWIQGSCQCSRGEQCDASQRDCRQQTRTCAVIKRAPNLYCWRRHGLRGFVTTGVKAEPTNSNGGLSPDYDIYVSTSTDPYFNLTLEDWLFRHSPESKPLLLIYRDSPCVVIGRNQNPWTEVNFPALRAAGIPFLRRRSGGGTVYHVRSHLTGIHLPRASFDRHATGGLGLRAIRSLAINACLNDRNDMCVGSDKMSLDSGTCSTPPTFSLYVSGFAYKIVNKRAYHHGPMLITTKLDALGGFLHPQKNNIVTKGVASVRSAVSNLQKYAASTTHESFTSAVVTEFRREFGIGTDMCVVPDSQETKSIGYIRKGMSELSTWEWAYSQTPEFTHTLSNTFSWGDVTVEIRSKHGIILDCLLLVDNAVRVFRHR
ncbi:hypothetical protein BDZ97DRAFT_1657230 [Flammula alnicola]|nr:hypothetical protein BDZ97DRAFT_1657230 [Flammula alnicola]